MHCQSDLCCTVWWSWRGRHPNKGWEIERSSTLRLKLSLQNPVLHGKSRGFEVTQTNITQHNELKIMVTDWSFQDKLIWRSFAIHWCSRTMNLRGAKMQKGTQNKKRNLSYSPQCWSIEDIPPSYTNRWKRDKKREIEKRKTVGNYCKLTFKPEFHCPLSWQKYTIDGQPKGPL